ncbi:hypothetical protein ACIBKX_32240 [Streptomyces sp. NPDC050658]|uniref:hypothetical protein n=1 Tax=unclassified Streptomyces TaxID=2593676 RepID=UPI003434B38F
MLIAKKLLAGAAASVLASTALIGGMTAAATPAAASAYDCQEYLRGWYNMTPPRIEACGRAVSGTLGGRTMCVTQLVTHGVASRHATNACDLADN